METNLRTLGPAEARVVLSFREQGRDIAFLSKVVIEFQIMEKERHYHIPLLLSRYSCASYRGS